MDSFILFPGLNVRTVLRVHSCCIDSLFEIYHVSLVTFVLPSLSTLNSYIFSLLAVLVGLG